jgi:dienelactone hydrolase
MNRTVLTTFDDRLFNIFIILFFLFPMTAQADTSPRNANEYVIDSSYHPLGNELVAVLHLPEGASAENPVAGCAIIHGSGGLFKEISPGQSCSQNVENSYQKLSDRLLNAGIATIMPSSFYSRDERFCEDNDSDYIAYGAAPFFNGDDPITRDTSYKLRRVAIRTMDMVATMAFFCDLEQVDCNKTCMIGTSNGGTSIMSYTAQSLPKDLSKFIGEQKRPFEYNSTHAKRNVAFANFPELTVSEENLQQQLSERPLPRFGQLISPGCSMRDLVADIEPGNESKSYALNELFYPANDSQLIVEVGTLDSVPGECYIDAPNGEGLREIQAKHFEQQMVIAPQDSRYQVHIHQGGAHNLLDDDDIYASDILNRLDILVEQQLLY